MIIYYCATLCAGYVFISPLFMLSVPAERLLQTFAAAKVLLFSDICKFILHFVQYLRGITLINTCALMNNIVCTYVGVGAVVLRGHRHGIAVPPRTYVRVLRGISGYFSNFFASHSGF